MKKMYLWVGHGTHWESCHRFEKPRERVGSWEQSSEIGQLPSMCEILGSSPNTTMDKRIRKVREDERMGKGRKRRREGGREGKDGGEERERKKRRKERKGEQRRNLSTIIHTGFSRYLRGWGRRIIWVPEFETTTRNKENPVFRAM